MYSLPTTIITSNGKEHKISKNGDFRIVLECFEAINDSELSEDERVLASLLIFYNEFSDFDDILTLHQDELSELIIKMFEFINTTFG